MIATQLNPHLLRKMQARRAEDLAQVAGVSARTLQRIGSVGSGDVAFSVAVRIANLLGYSVAAWTMAEADESTWPRREARKTDRTFGEVLKDHRKRRRWTREELSAKARIPLTTLTNMEAKKGLSVRLGRALAVAEALGVGVSEFEHCAGIILPTVIPDGNRVAAEAATVQYTDPTVPDDTPFTLDDLKEVLKDIAWWERGELVQFILENTWGNELDSVVFDWLRKASGMERKLLALMQSEGWLPSDKGSGR